VTVSSVTNRVSYTGNGSTTAFAFSHPFRLTADLVVTVRTTATGAESLKTEGSDYTVSGTSDSGTGGYSSGTVTFGTAPASGTQVHIDRVVTRTQTADFISGDGIPPASIEGALDKLTQTVQELDARFARTLLQPRTAANRNLILPEPTTATANQVIGVNSAGTGYSLRSQTANTVGFALITDYGAVAGTSDSSTAIQAAIDAVYDAGGGTVAIPSAEFTCSNIKLKSNVRLLGLGPTSTLKAPSGLGSSTVLLRNNTLGSYTDSDITIEGVTFDGNNAGAGGTQTRFSELLSFGRVTDLRIVDCTIQNVQYIGAAFAGCRRVFITHCELTGCGYQGTTTNGGSAFWFSNYPSSTDVTRDVAVTDCFIHDNNWHAVQFSVTCGVISGCSFRANKESHIFSSRLLPNVEASEILIANNTFTGVTKKDISAHAIESGAVKLVITGNTIKNSDHGGIALTDVQDAIVSDNVIVNSTLLTATGWGAIDFICSATGTDRVRNVSVRGNRVYDDQAVPTTRHAVRFQGSGDAALNCSIVNNDFAGTTYASGVFDLGTKGTAAVRKNNLGTTDNYPIPVVGEFQTPASTGAYSVTGLAFKPVRVEFLATAATGSTAAYQSNSIVNAAGTAICHGFSATNAPAMNSTTHGNFAVKLTDTAGSTITSATFTSHNSDGFTINFATVSTRPWIRYIAYPE